MPVEDKRDKGQAFTTLRDNEEKDLSRLLDLLNTPASKQQLPSISWVTDENQNTAANPWAAQTNALPHQHQSTEALALEKFSSRYQGVRNFSSHTHQGYFTQIFTALVKQRVCYLEWIERVPPENILRVLICLRMLMRDPTFQVEFFNLGGVKVLSERLQLLTESYLENGEEPFTVDILKEMTNICQKLSADVKQREWLVACNTHKALVLLLSASDVMVLHCSLYALIGLAQSERPRALIGELNCMEILLRILQEYDMLSKTLAAGLLRVLCADSNIREQVKMFDGIPICLSLLHCDNLKLLWNVVWIVVQLAEDADSSNDIRLLGGIPLLLSLLQDRKQGSDILYLGSDSSKASISGEPIDVDSGEETIPLKIAVCSALTELVVNDTNGQQIVQSNGIYLLGLLILPQETSSSDEAATVDHLQKSAFRALRFLFSMERNRQLFKRLFPPDLFEKFIDIGHYVRDLNAYKPLVDKITTFTEEDISVIRNNILATNQNKAPSHSVGSYEVLELLGSGAFGSVYKVRKKNAGQTFLAMKEMSVHNPALGKTAKDRGKSVGEIVNETTIMKEQLRHPNVVKYHKAFQEKDKLYVIMELVEGAPLGEHFNSLKEKGTRFSEERIWHIFIQIVLGLRYIHKEKHIVHRDLTPNNIMLGENDKVTITDFGLAKQKNPDASKMTSMVGTILYSCPEVVQSQPYGEKADVWASGCILYQMATLQPPFHSSNMLALATKIVEAQYEPIPPGQYSDKVSETVSRCLTPNPDNRPDIVQVASIISEIMLVYVDKLRSNEISLEKKLERERKRTQRHYIEATRNMQNYHRLFYASQERYDKLVNLSSSGGAAGLRTVDTPEGSDTVFEAANALAELNLNKNGVVKNGESDPIYQVDSGIDIGDIQPNGSLGSQAGSPEQNGGAKHGGNLSPGSSRRQRTLKPVTGKSGKGSVEKVTASAKDKDKSSASGKNGSEKGSNGRTIVEKINSVTSNSHVFAVPKPPGPRKGPRRQLHVDFAVDSKTGTTNGTSSSGATHGVTSSGVSGPGISDVSSRRSQSSSAVEMYRRQSGGQFKARPPTAAATLSISPRKVRQINDPISQILNQLHKVIFITQLPPTLSPNPQRRIVEQFKRALFAPHNSSFVNLKSEVKKVIEGSREVIDLKFGFGDPLFLHHQQDTAEKLVSGVNLESADAQEIGITYEMMQNIIENVLMESGYYDMSPCPRNRTVPLGPIGTVQAPGGNLGPSKRGPTS